jgi:hypothetical protein
LFSYVVLTKIVNGVPPLFVLLYVSAASVSPLRNKFSPIFVAPTERPAVVKFAQALLDDPLTAVADVVPPGAVVAVPRPEVVFG